MARPSRSAAATRRMLVRISEEGGAVPLDVLLNQVGPRDGQGQ